MNLHPATGRSVKKYLKDVEKRKKREKKFKKRL